MNSNSFRLNSSSSPSHSWIVNNLRSIISNQDDDSKDFSNSNDNTLIASSQEDELSSVENKDANFSALDQKLFDAKCDFEVENMRTICNFDSGEVIERLAKRPFSPEEIREPISLKPNATPFYPFNFNNHFIDERNNSKNWDETNLSDHQDPIVCANGLPSTSEYFSDNNLNLDDSNPYRSRLFQSIQPQNQLLNNHLYDYSDMSVKKKKLSNSSSMIVPKLSVTKPESCLFQADSNTNLGFNNSILSNDLNSDDFMSFNKNNHSMTSSFLFSSSNSSSLTSISSLNCNGSESTSPTTSFFLTSNFNNSKNFAQNSCLLNQPLFNSNSSNSANFSLINKNQFITNTSTPSNKLFNNTKSNNLASSNEFKANNPMFQSFNNQEIENRSFYDIRKAYGNNSSFLSCTNNVNNRQNIGSDETRSLASSRYLNDPIGKLNYSNNLGDGPKKNLNKYHLSKKITKSSTTLFKENNSAQCFTHSNSYDNMNILRNEANNSQNNFLANKCFNRDISSDFTDSSSSQLSVASYSSQNNWQNGASFNKQQPEKQHYHQQQYNQQSNQQQQQQQQQISYNNSDCLDREHIILHVKNLDYKISADEWKRILTENFRKHCKEVT